MAVYFVQAEKSKSVKIGSAKDPWSRLSMLQVGCPEHLKILRVEEGGQREEVAYHREFESSWIRGEWFTFEPHVSTYLREVSESDVFARKYRAKKMQEKRYSSTSEVYADWIDESYDRLLQEGYDQWVKEKNVRT